MPSADMLAAHTQAMGARVESVAADSVCAPVAFSLSGRASSDASATSSLGVELGLPAMAVPGKQLVGGERHVYFNILVAGQSKLGKSRFIASLADTFGTDGANKRPARSSSSGLGATGRSASATLDRHARELQTHLTPLALPGRPGRQLHTMLQDTQGHGSENNKTVHLSKLLEHLLRQREADYRAARSGGGGGAGEPPALPHSLSLCLYFLPPTEVSALDLAYMSALSQEVPLLPVLVPQPDAPEQAGGGPVSAERLAALRRSLVAAMAGYTRDGKAAPIVPLALDPEAVDALPPQQHEVEEVEAQEQARQAAAGSGGDNGARMRRRGSASSLSVLVLGDGAAGGGAAAVGSLQRPDAALLRRLLDCSVEPVMRSAAERFAEFCERYEMYGNDLMFMLSERMEPYGKVIRAAEAADAEVAARRQQEAAAAAAAAKSAGLLEAKATAHGVAESGVIHVIVRDASLTITEHAGADVIAHDAAHTAAEHEVTQSAMAAAPSSHATKRGHDSLQGSAADADTEDAYRHAARPRAVTPAPAAASPFSVFATDAASAAAAASDSCGAVARSSTPRFAAPPATADAFATPLPPRPPSPEPEHCGEGQGDVERVVSAIEEIVTQLSRSLEGSGSDGEHGSAGVLPRGASTTALGARFGTLAEEGEEEVGDVGMAEAEAEEEVAGGAEWEDGAVVAEAAVVGVDQVEMHAAVEEEAGAAAPAPATAAGVFSKLASSRSGKLLASMASAGSGKLLASVASVRRYWSRSLDGSAPEARSDSDVAATASADAPAAAGISGAWPAAVARYVPATATSAAVGVGLMGLAAGTAAVVLLQRSRSAAITA